MEARTFQRQRANATILALACVALAFLFTSCGGGAATSNVLVASAAGISLSNASIIFSSQPVGTTSVAQTVAVTNTGNAVLTIPSLAVTGANAGDFVQTNTCGSSVAAGANCTLSVTFTPSATGARSASVSITDNATGSPHTVSLTGTGQTTAPVAALSATSLPFGNQPVGTTSSPQSATLSNTGNAVLTITSLAVTGANASNFVQTNTCGSSVAAGANCTISVTFTPSATGARSASVSITDNASGSTHAVGLTGTGTSAAPVVSPSPTSLAFGNQAVGATSAARTVTLRNTGNAVLTLTGLAVTGTNASNFAQTNTCGSSVAAGANCTLSVTFTPSATGTRTASVRITDNASGSPHTVGLTGTGTTTAPIVSLSPTSLPFGNQAVATTSAARTVTLRNTGNAVLTITGLTVTGTNASNFAQTNTCGSSVAAGANCTLSVTFAPSATGARSASVRITDNASGSPHTVGLTGTGTSAAPIASLSPTSLPFGNQPVGTMSSPQTVTLSNTGNVVMTIASLAVTGTNASDFIPPTNNCGSSLAAGANCTIVVSFTPSAIGNRAASVSITDNASGSPHTVPLSGVGVHYVALSWTASTTSDVVGYNVYRGTALGGPYPTLLNSSPIDGATYIDATVQAGQTYYYVARAVASDGATESADSNSALAAVPSP